MYINKKTISKGLISYIFALILIEPAALRYFDFTNRIFTIAQSVLLLIVLYLQFFNVNKRVIIRKRSGESSRVVILLIIYYAYFLVNTYIQNGRTMSILTQAIQFIGFAIFIDIILKNNPNTLFKTILNILTVYVVANCFCVLLMPNGLYTTSYYSNNYLLGYDNQNINFILPALLLVLLKNVYYKSCKLHILLVYAAAWITAIKIWSGMTLVVVTLMTLLGVLSLKKKKGYFHKYIFTDKIFNSFTLLVTNIAAFVAIVIFQLQVYFEYIIVNILQRNLTLTSRTIIWERNIQYIKASPIFGYGREVYTTRAVKIGFVESSPAGLHAHNRFLEVMYCGGVVLLGLYIYILVYSAKKLTEVKTTFYAKILSFGIFVYMFGMLTEYYDYCIFFWAFLVMAENAKHVCAERKE